MGRLVLFVLSASLVLHVVACLWALQSVLASGQEKTETWAATLPEEYTNMERYLSAFYWAVQTITTVGYGDNDVTTVEEKSFCILAMVIGVISFSFGTGALANLIQNADEKNAALKSR